MAPIQMKARAPSFCSQPMAGCGVTGAGAGSNTGTGGAGTVSSNGGGSASVGVGEGCSSGSGAGAASGMGTAAGTTPAANSIWRRRFATSSASRAFCSRRPEVRTRATMAAMGVPIAQATAKKPRRIRPPSSTAAPAAVSSPPLLRRDALSGPLLRHLGEVGAAVLGDLAALHDETVVLLAGGTLDVGQRVAVAQHEVGRVSLLDATFVDAHQVGGAGGREEQRIAGRDADLAHELELLGVLAVPVVRRAGVGAHRDLAARLVVHLDRRDVAVKHAARLLDHVVWDRAVAVVVALQDVLHGRQRRHQPHAALLHFLDAFVGHEDAVLDRIDAAAHR